MILSALLLVLFIVDMVYSRKQNYKALFYTSLSLTVVLAAVVASDFLTGHPIVAVIMAVCFVFFGARTLALKQYR